MVRVGLDIVRTPLSIVESLDERCGSRCNPGTVAPV
jgi:hypothetical protein